MPSITRRQIAAAGVAPPLLIPKLARPRHANADPTSGGIGSGGAEPGAGAGSPILQPPTSFVSLDPVLAPAESGPKEVELTAQETTINVAKDVAYAGWSFGGTIPSRPILVVAGDPVKVTVKSHAKMARSLDTHAAKTPPTQNYIKVLPGEEFEWEFTRKYPGAFFPLRRAVGVDAHRSRDARGSIVDPNGGWSPAQELVFVQSEFNLTRNGAIKTPDFARLMRLGTLDDMAFNPYANQDVEHPTPVKAGAPIRIFAMNAGPNIWSVFHVVDAIFDALYLNANPQNHLGGLQSVSIGPGDETCVEFALEEPGTYTAANRSFGHAHHGAIALLEAS